MSESAISEAKSRTLDSINAGFAIIAVVAVPLSLSRVVTTGWLPIYGIHCVLGIIVVSIWLLRKTLPLDVRFWGTESVMWAIGLSGLTFFGLMGAGTWWLVMSALIAGMIKSPRYCIVMMLCALAVVIVMGVAHVSGIIGLKFDANIYAKAPTSWVLYLVAAVMLPLIVFTAFANQFGIVAHAIVETAAARDEYKRQAEIDPLSGVFRPHVFFASVEFAIAQLRRNRGLVAVVFIDVDNFKPINDQHGHAVGDEIITEVAKRLRGSLREEDVIARLGGDEFAVLLTNVDDKSDVETAAEKILSVVALPYHAGKAIIPISISMGAAICSSASFSASELVKQADSAMYDAKKAGGTAYRINNLSDIAMLEAHTAKHGGISF